MLEIAHQGLDIETVKFFNQFCGKSIFLDTLSLVFLSVDALRTAILVAVVIGIWEFGKTKNDFDSKKKAISILFSIILSLGVIEILNAVIDSPRPIVTYETLINSPIVSKNTKSLWVDGWVRNTKHGSFPSDTVALLAVMAFGIFSWNRLLGIVSILFVVLAGIFPRLYFGLHYPSDMLIGCLVSFLACFITERTKALNPIYERIFEVEKKHPFGFGFIGFYLAYIIADKFILIRKLPLWIKVMLGS